MSKTRKIRTIDPAVFEIDYENKRIRMVAGDVRCRVGREWKTYDRIGEVQEHETLLVIWPPGEKKLADTPDDVGFVAATELGTVIDTDYQEEPQAQTVH